MAIPGIGHNAAKRSRFAIMCDVDAFPDVRDDIGRALKTHGFDRQQGSVYFGDDTVDAVRCVLAVQDLARSYDWFSPSVRDIRMLRIEDNNDLMPAVAVARP